MKIKNILANEMEKFLNGKYFKVMIIFAILWVLINLSILLFMGGLNEQVIQLSESGQLAQKNAEEVSKLLEEAEQLSIYISELTGVEFLEVVVEETFYRGLFFFISVIFTLFAISMFKEDDESGNMKYTIISGVTYKEILIGKLIFMIVYGFIFIAMIILFSLVFGQIFFGGKVVLVQMFRPILRALFSIFPIISIGSIMFFLSQTKIILVL